MSFSKIGNSVGESVTLKLNQTAAMLKAKGEPIIHLGGGEPKSKAPIEAIESAIALVKTGEVRYGPAGGTPEMKKAIIKYNTDYYKYEIKSENIIASGGAKQSIMVALQAILDPGDEVVFPVPYWVSYPDMVKLCGAVPVPVRPKDNSFYPTLKDIESACTSKTKIIIINSPSNPCGAMYSEQFIAEMVNFCEKREIYLMMDDIYHRLIFEGRKLVSAFSFLKRSLDESKLIVINGASKQYAMTGFRIGWAVAGKALIKVMTNIQGHQTSGPSNIAQVAAVSAINGPQTSVEELRLSLEENTKVMMEQLATIPGVKATKPDGTFYCFADFSHFDKDSTRLAYFLLEKVLVISVPGIEFGLDGFLRLSTCGSSKDIIEGIQRIKWALDPNSPKEFMIGERRLVKDW